jgi:iron complex transport system substrate-binding protein
VRTERIARRVGWNNLAAVRNGHIYEVKSAYILEPGPASLTEGLQQLYGILSRVRNATT